MSDIPLQSRLEKSLDFTQHYLKKPALSKAGHESVNNSQKDTINFENLLLLENQRIEDEYLIKQSENRKVTSQLESAQEEIVKLKEAHDQAEINLQSVLKDLELAIIENQKLNSERKIDTSNISVIQAENHDLTSKLHDMEKRFRKFVQESIKMSSRENELIGLLENAEEKLAKQDTTLEIEQQVKTRLKEENDALLQVSIGLEKMIKDMESRELKSHEELLKVSQKLEEMESEKLKQEWDMENFNTEIASLKERCVRQENIFREKYQSEINRLKSEFSAEKCRLAKELEELADKAHNLQITCDRAIRDKRSAESELHKLLHVLPNQTDSLEGMIDDLNRRLVASEKQRTEALHSAEDIHQKYINQLTVRDVEQRSYQTAIFNATERAKKAESEHERLSVENLGLVTKISALEKHIAELLEEKKQLMSSHELEKRQLLEEHKANVLQLEKTISEAKKSAEITSKEINQLLNQQKTLSVRWKQEAEQLCRKHDASVSHIKSQMARMQQRAVENEEERLKLKAIKSDLIKQIGLERQEMAALNERLTLSESRNLSLERQVAALIGKESMRILKRNGISSEVL